MDLVRSRAKRVSRRTQRGVWQVRSAVAGRRTGAFLGQRPRRRRTSGQSDRVATHRRWWSQYVHHRRNPHFLGRPSGRGTRTDTRVQQNVVARCLHAVARSLRWRPGGGHLGIDGRKRRHALGRIQDRRWQVRKGNPVVEGTTMKSEIRNPKSETSSKFEMRKSQNPPRVQRSRLQQLLIAFIRICFGFRISDFGFALSSMLLVVLTANRAMADVKPHVLFSENSVLQQQMNVPVWGTAGDGEKVTVEIQDQKVSTTAANGAWKVVLKPLTAGGPFTLKISGANNTVTFTNIAVGEVWVCSGQSNMASGLGDVEGGPEEKEKANHSLLRIMAVPLARSAKRARDS